MKWLKKNLSSLILVLILLIGLSLLLYPSFSDYWNSLHQSKAIASYAAQVVEINNDEYEYMLEDARVYNQTLVDNEKRYIMSEEEYAEYTNLLNVGGTGILGYIEIPSIEVSLPIYHGVDEAVLQIAVGHIEGTSLPIGGESTHSVLSGHRGLPSAKLFTDLDQMVVGDLFVIRVLDETFTYEVDQIRIVEPHNLSELEIEKGKDLCTLVTCTPYGINTHRLLVRGHRVANVESAKSIRVTADAIQIDPVMVAPIVAIPILLLLLIWLFVHYRKR